MTDVVEYNRRAWNAQSLSGTNEWCMPVDAAAIKAARTGKWSVVLTPSLPVPQDWFGDIKGKRVLGLASGGGQQVPLFAAAGAIVTCIDASDEQLAKDGEVATREGLDITLERGDMADLSRFEDASFDLIFHPVSNSFAKDIAPVWAECHRVLKPGGRLLAGFMNPIVYAIDWEQMEAGGPIEIRHPLPWSDVDHLPEDQLDKLLASGAPLEFGHSLEAQIGGQIAAGFSIQGFYEDRWSDDRYAINRFMPTAIATLAVK